MAQNQLGPSERVFFDAADANGREDGHLTFEEWETMMKKLKPGASEKEIKQWFHIADTNANDKISLKEFKEYVEGADKRKEFV